MIHELRPSWCVGDEEVESLIEFGRWEIDGGPAFDRHGDDWQPGECVTVTRTFERRSEPVDLRRRLGLTIGQVVGVGARWACRATSTAGVHVGGPGPLKLFEKADSITLEIPSEIADSIEIETVLIVKSTSAVPQSDTIPDGSVLWSDGWSVPTQERSILLEGSEARIPVRSVSFAHHFGEASSALWAIDLDPIISLDDLVANVVTVLLNKDRTVKDFPGVDGEPDVSKIPSSLLAGMNVDLVRSLAYSLKEELVETNWERLQDLAPFEDGTVAKLLGIHLVQTFGSAAGAMKTLQNGLPLFDRRLWDLFAPKSWSFG